jgi:hypothetical protein
VIGRQIGSRIPASPMVPENRVIGKKTVFTWEMVTSHVTALPKLLTYSELLLMRFKFPNMAFKVLCFFPRCLFQSLSSLSTRSVEIQLSYSFSLLSTWKFFIHHLAFQDGLPSTHSHCLLPPWLKANLIYPWILQIIHKNLLPRNFLFSSGL